MELRYDIIRQPQVAKNTKGIIHSQCSTATTEKCRVKHKDTRGRRCFDERVKSNVKLHSVATRHADQVADLGIWDNPNITEQDHLKWGILDRAENLFKHVAASWITVVNHENGRNHLTAPCPTGTNEDFFELKWIKLKNRKKHQQKNRQTQDLHLKQQH